MSADNAEQLPLSTELARLEADLIAMPVARLLAQRPDAQVIQLFSRSVNLTTSSGELFSLTLPGLDAGPFAICLRSNANRELNLLDILGQSFRELRVTVSEEDLTIGRLNVNLQSAKTWDPRLVRGRLRGAKLEVAVGHLHDFLRRYAPVDSLFWELSASRSSWIATRIGEAWNLIEQAIARTEPEHCRTGAQLAAGAGIGLTPAGDDFLIGVLLAFWLAMPDPTVYVNSLLAGTLGRTGRLSMALLQAAGRGEAGQTWHAMVVAVARLEAQTIRGTATILLDAGHTSGADALLGFTLALETINRRPLI